MSKGRYYEIREAERLVRYYFVQNSKGYTTRIFDALEKNPYALNANIQPRRWKELTGEENEDYEELEVMLRVSRDELLERGLIRDYEERKEAKPLAPALTD